MIYCVAATISWALVFSDPPANSITMEPQAYSCFSEKASCQGAAFAANNAFALDRSAHRAYCEEQPAGDPAKFRSNLKE